MLFRVIGLTVALGEAINPITRIAQLLQGISEKIESDGKAEKVLYDDFVCWCKTIESQKTQSNAVANQRISDLTAYIDDIENGRVEFTSERQDLAKEIDQLQNQLEKEKATRDQNREDFEKSKAEMNAAITALDGAIQKLKDGTTDQSAGGKGLLLSTRFALRKVLYPNKSNTVAYMEQAMEKALAPPKKKDWERLDGDKSTFSKDYDPRSFKIQDMLAEMKTTFQSNLDSATKAENEAEASYTELRTKKQETLENTKTAALSLTEETAARDKTKTDSKQEKEDLEKQVEDDTRILTETEATCAAKKEEFQKRSTLRTEEIASIAEAIGILRSDDNRDMFNRSFDSQTPDFLQITHRHLSSGCAEARKKKAIKILSQIGTTRLRTVSYLVATKRNTPKTDEFPGNVISSIDEVLLDLKKEGENDETEKNECENFRATKTAEAKTYSNEIDDHTEKIGQHTETIQNLIASIKEKEDEKKAIEEAVAEAALQRNRTAEEFLQSQADDAEAMTVIQRAIDALKKFYDDNQLGLVQERKATPPEITAGEAPPPPPATWDEPYGGQKAEHQGVVAILELIKEDVKKDKEVAEEEETKAKEAWTKFKTESEGDITSLDGMIDEAKIQKGNEETGRDGEETDRDTKKGSLKTLLGVVKAEEPKCNFITINFEKRKKLRYTEKDGLEKAKAVLQGGNFPSFLAC